MLLMPFTHHSYHEKHIAVRSTSIYDYIMHPSHLPLKLPIKRSPRFQVSSFKQPAVISFLRKRGFLVLPLSADPTSSSPARPIPGLVAPSGRTRVPPCQHGWIAGEPRHEGDRRGNGRTGGEWAAEEELVRKPPSL